MPAMPVLGSVGNVCRFANLRRFNGLRQYDSLRGPAFRRWQVLHVFDFRHVKIFIDSYSTYMLTYCQPQPVPDRAVSRAESAKSFGCHTSQEFTIVTPLLATDPKSLVLSPLVATHPRPPGPPFRVYPATGR